MSFENLIDAYESASADSNGDYTFSYATFPLIVGVADFRQIELQWTPSQVTRVSDGALVSINDLSPSDASLAAIVPAGALVFDSFTHTVRLVQSAYVGSSFTGDSNVIYNRTDLVLPTDARPIYVKRATPLDAKLVTYQSGSKIAASTMNLADDQYFNALQEVKAGVDFVAGSLSTVGTIEVSISPNGSVATAGDLPASADQGDLYVVLDTGDAYTYNGVSWDNIGPLRGADGAQGSDGNAATITVGTVTDGAEGDPASVTNVGTANAAQLDFVLPVGATGPQGIQGLTGADSIVAGPTGSAGIDRLALLLPDTEYTIGQAPSGQPLYQVTKTFGATLDNHIVWDETTDGDAQGTQIVTIEVLQWENIDGNIGSSQTKNDNASYDFRVNKQNNTDVWTYMAPANASTITLQYTKNKDGVDNAISTADFNILELDNFIAPTNILRLNQEVEIGQATNGKPLYSVTKEILNPSDTGVLYSIDSDAELQHGEVLSYTQGGVLHLINSNGNDNNETGYTIWQDPSHARNEFKFKTGISNNDTLVVYRLFYTKVGDGVSDTVPVNELANVTIDNHIAPSNMLVSGREYEIGQAPSGQPMYSMVKELTANFANIIIWDENLGGDIAAGSKVVQIVPLTYRQSNFVSGTGYTSGDNPHMTIRTSTAGQYKITTNASAANFQDGYVRIFYTKNTDPIQSIITAPEYSQLQAIYAESGTPTSQILKLDEEILVGQAPDGRPLYQMTRNYGSSNGYQTGDGVRFEDGVAECAGQTTLTVQVIRVENTSGIVYTGEAGAGNFWQRNSDGTSWKYDTGSNTLDLISTRFYTKDAESILDLRTPDEFATLALDTYQSPALSFNTSSSDIQVGTWTTGQPLYKRSYEFSSTLVSGEELWRDINTEQSVKGDIVLFEGAGATIRSYDDNSVFVELTPQVGVDQRIATIVGGGITNSIIDRYFIKTDETAADIDQIVGIPDAPSDSNQYARKDGAWDIITGGSSGGGASELDDLSDVNTSSVTLGDVLVYGETGSVFAPRALAAADISDFSTAVALAAPVLSVTGGTDISVTNVGSNVFEVSYTGSGGGSNPLTDLEDLNDVPSYVTGDGDKILQADASGTLTWEDVPTGGSGSGIVLSDLSVSQVTAGINALSYDNTTGIFQFTPTDLSGLAPLVHTHTASDITDFNSSVDARINVKDLAQGTNVTITESGGTYTINATSSGGGASAINDLSDVDTATAGPAIGDVLEWDGSNWAPATPSSGGGGGSMAYLQTNYDTTSLASAFGTTTYVSPDFDATNKISSGDETLNSSEQYEVPATGLYRLTFSAHSENTESRYGLYAQFAVNGTQVGIEFSDYGRTQADGGTVTGEMLVELTSGDAVNVEYRTTLNTGTGFNAYGQFSYLQLS